MPPTPEPLGRNFLDETSVRIFADETDRRARGRTPAQGCATVGARTLRFALGRFSDRKHRPLIRMGLL
jgi:hypothetical protein